jgi:hypothetical protein
MDGASESEAPRYIDAATVMRRYNAVTLPMRATRSTTLQQQPRWFPPVTAPPTKFEAARERLRRAREKKEEEDSCLLCNRSRRHFDEN